MLPFLSSCSNQDWLKAAATGVKKTPVRNTPYSTPCSLQHSMIAGHSGSSQLSKIYRNWLWKENERCIWRVSSYAAWFCGCTDTSSTKSIHSHLLKALNLHLHGLEHEWEAALFTAQRRGYTLQEVKISLS